MKKPQAYTQRVYLICLILWLYCPFNRFLPTARLVFFSLLHFFLLLKFQPLYLMIMIMIVKNTHTHTHTKIENILSFALNFKIKRQNRVNIGFFMEWFCSCIPSILKAKKYNIFNVFHMSMLRRFTVYFRSSNSLIFGEDCLGYFW